MSVCEFFNKKRNMCEAKKIVEQYGNLDSGLNVGRLRNGYKEIYCKLPAHKFCMRKIKLYAIIKDGDYDDG